MPISDSERNKNKLELERALPSAARQREAADAGPFQEDVTAGSLLESLAEGVVVVDGNGTIVLVNARAQQMFGYSKEELEGQPHYLLIPQRYRQGHSRHEASFFAAPTSRVMGRLRDLAGLRRDGTEFPLEISLGVVQGKNGNTLVLALVSDITIRKQAEQALQEIEELFHIQMDCMKDYAIYMIDPNGRVLNWNAGAERLNGYRADEIVGRDFACFYADEDREAQNPSELLKKAEAEGQTEAVGWRVRRDGSLFWAEQIVTALRDDCGNLRGFSNVTRDISERKLAEDAQRLSEARYRALYDDNPTMIITIDSEFTMLSVNPMCVRQLKYTPEELEGQPVLKLFHEDDGPAVTEQLQLCFSNPNQVYCRQFRKVDKEGGVLWVEETAHAVYDKNSSLNVLVVCHDITERKRAEEALQQSEQRFQAIFDLAAVGIAQLSLQGKWLLMNRKLCDILGYGCDELRLMNVAQITHPEELEPHLEFVQRLLKGEIATYTVEKRYLHKEGFPVWVNLNVNLVRDAVGAPQYFIAVVEDINERKRAEEQLRESEEKFSRIFELAPIGITISTLADGNFVDINEAGLRLCGYSRDEVVGHSMFEFCIWREPEERAKVIAQVLEKGEVRDREMTMKDKSGRIFWALFSAVIVEVRGEKYLLSLVSDIGERKKAQEALQESEERFRLLADAAPVMIWEAGSDAGCTFFNKPWLEFTGRSLEQELGYGWTENVHPDDLERCLETYRTAFAKQQDFSMEYRLRRPDGQYSWVSDTGVPRLAPDGHLIGYIGTCFDITERKLAREELQKANEMLAQRVAERTAELSLTVERLQDEIKQRIRMGQALQEETSERLNVQAQLREKELMLLQQSRLAAMGEMIGNIAHQWRQPLNLLGLLAQDLPMTYTKGDFNYDYLQGTVKKMLETIRHMSTTIDDFRNFFRPIKEKVDFRIMEIVERTISLLGGSLNAQQITTEVVAEGDPVVNGYPNEFSQVLLNIMINARDAFLKNTVANAKIVIKIRTEKGRCVVTIADNAGGIPDEIIDKIFDPYFTTKGPDKGTGVGLFMSKTIIEKNMNGSLSARNVDSGAEFRIEL
jgi:PAS domain S-box-containing protein